MITLSDGIDLCFKFVPIIQSMATSKFRNDTQNKIDKMKLDSIDEIEKKTSGLTPGSKEPKVKLPTGWQEGEDVPQLGHRYWTGYHAAVDSLPENASPGEVKTMLKQIEKNARNFPCPSCRENAIEILDNSPLASEDITTKKDGQLALCKFHNSVSEHVGNKTVNCERTYAA